MKKLIIIAMLLAVVGLSCAEDEVKKFTLTAREPAQRGEVMVDIKPELTFSDKIKPASISSKTIEFVNEAGEPVKYSTDVTEPTNHVTIIPKLPLDFDQIYSVRVSSGIKRSTDNRNLDNPTKFSFATPPVPPMMRDLKTIVEYSLIEQCPDTSCIRGSINDMVNGITADLGDYTAKVYDSKGGKLAKTGDGEVVYWGTDISDVNMTLWATGPNKLYYRISLENNSEYYGVDYEPDRSPGGAVRIAAIHLDPDPLDTWPFYGRLYVALDIHTLLLQGDIIFNDCENLFYYPEFTAYKDAGCDLTSVDATIELADDAVDYIALQCTDGGEPACDVAEKAVKNLGVYLGDMIGPSLNDPINQMFPENIGEMIMQ